MAAKITTESAVVAALRQRFPPPAWAMFAGVANGTGHRANRWADAVSMGIWPSRGLEVAGFEVKVQRSDWLRELKKPEKAESIFAFCDRWWIAAGSKDIVRDGELPPTWGLLVPHGKTMKIVVDAPKLKPKPLSRTFMAAILRRATEYFDESRIRSDLRGELLKEAEEHAKSDASYAIERQRDRAEKAEKRARELEDAMQEMSGSTWGAETIGQAISLLLALKGWNGAIKDVEHMLGRLKDERDSLEKIEGAVGDVKKMLDQLGVEWR